MKVSIKNQRKMFKTEEEIKLFVESIENAKEVTFLELTGNLIHNEVADKLSVKIKEMCKLKHLNFSRIVPTMPSIKMRASFDSLFKNIDPLSIKSLNISENALSWELPEGFCRFLVEAKNLEYLRINDCGLGINGTTLLLEKLVEGKGNLKYLNISRNKITTGAETIGKLIKQLTHLKTLKINSNTIYKQSLEIFLQDIHEMDLKELDLTDNNLNEESCSLLGKMYVNNKMTKLKIAECLMYDSGLKSFLNSCEKHRKEKDKGSLLEKLEELHLGKTEFLEKQEINENIVSTVSLEENVQFGKLIYQSIDISYNDLTQGGINEFTKFIKNETNMKLSIFGNDYEDISELVGCIEKNRGLVICEDPEEEPSDPFVDIVEFMEKVNIISGNEL